MTPRTAAQYIIVFSVGFGLAAVSVGALGKDSGSKEAKKNKGERAVVEQSRSSRMTRHRIADQVLPEVEIVFIPLMIGQREAMIKKNPHAGTVTWTDIARAERELVQPEIALYLGDGHDLGIDCFEPHQVWPEFHYKLSVTVTPEKVSIGEFQITSSELPSRTVRCLEELFAGTVTLDIAPKLKRTGLRYMPIETVLHRESDFVKKATRDLSTNGRKHIIDRTEADLLEVPQDVLMKEFAQ